MEARQRMVSNPTQPYQAGWEVLCAAVEQMDRKMLHASTQDSEWTQMYVVQTGPWHNILGIVRGFMTPGSEGDYWGRIAQWAKEERAQGNIQKADAYCDVLDLLDSQRYDRWSFDDD